MGSVAAESIYIGRHGVSAWPSRGVHSICSSTGRPSALHMARGGAGRGYPSTVMPAEVSWSGRSNAPFQRVRTPQWCARGTKGAEPARRRGPTAPSRRKAARDWVAGASLHALVRLYHPPGNGRRKGGRGRRRAADRALTGAAPNTALEKLSSARWAAKSGSSARGLSTWSDWLGRTPERAVAEGRPPPRRVR